MKSFFLFIILCIASINCLAQTLEVDVKTKKEHQSIIKDFKNTLLNESVETLVMYFSKSCTNTCNETIALKNFITETIYNDKGVLKAIETDNMKYIAIDAKKFTIQIDYTFKEIGEKKKIHGTISFTFNKEKNNTYKIYKIDCSS